MRVIAEALLARDEELIEFGWPPALRQVDQGT